MSSRSGGGKGGSSLRTQLPDGSEQGAQQGGGVGLGGCRQWGSTFGGRGLGLGLEGRQAQGGDGFEGRGLGVGRSGGGDEVVGHLVDEPQGEGFGGREPAVFAHQGGHLGLGAAGAGGVDAGHHGVEGGERAVDGAQAVHLFVHFLLVFRAPGGDEEGAVVDEQGSAAAHDDALRAHGQDGGGRCGHAHDVHHHAAVVGQSAADVEPVFERAAQGGEPHVHLALGSNGEGARGVVFGEAPPADGGGDVEVVGRGRGGGRGHGCIYKGVCGRGSA